MGDKKYNALSNLPRLTKKKTQTPRGEPREEDVGGIGTKVLDTKRTGLG